MAGRVVDLGDDGRQMGEGDKFGVGVVTERSAGVGVWVRNDGDREGKPGANEDEVGAVHGHDEEM